MNNSFSGYSLDNLKQIIQLLFFIEKDKHILHDLIKDDPSYFFEEIFPTPRWSSFYELTFLEHVGLVIYLTQQQDLFLEILTSDNPPEELITRLTDKYENEEPPPLLGSKLENRLFFAALFSLSYSLESMKTYGKSMNILVTEAFHGDVKSLEDAIRLDSSCICSPSLNSLISKAVLTNNKDLLKKIGAKLSLHPDTKIEHQELNYMLAVIDELNILEGLSKDDKYELMVKELRLYPQNPLDESKSRENFNSHVNRWKHKKKTQIQDPVSSLSINHLHSVLSHVLNNRGDIETWKISDTIKLNRKAVKFNKQLHKHQKNLQTSKIKKALQPLIDKVIRKR